MDKFDFNRFLGKSKAYLSKELSNKIGSRKDISNHFDGGLSALLLYYQLKKGYNFGIRHQLDLNETETFQDITNQLYTSAVDTRNLDFNIFEFKTAREYFLDDKDVDLDNLFRQYKHGNDNNYIGDNKIILLATIGLIISNMEKKVPNIYSELKHKILLDLKKYLDNWNPTKEDPIDPVSIFMVYVYQELKGESKYLMKPLLDIIRDRKSDGSWGQDDFPLSVLNFCILANLELSETYFKKFSNYIKKHKLDNELNKKFNQETKTPIITPDTTFKYSPTELGLEEGFRDQSPKEPIWIRCLSWILFPIILFAILRFFFLILGK